LIGRAREVLGGERGSIVPTVIGVLALTLLIGGVGMQQAGSANDSANRDRGVKRAIAAAEAGIDVAVYRMQKLKPTDSQPCVLRNVTTGALSLTGYPAGQTWCALVDETLGGGDTFEYRVSAPFTGSDGKSRRTVVSSGLSGGVRRRVALSTLTGASPLFAGFGVSSGEQFDISGFGGVTGNARSNKDIYLSGTGGVCGNAVPGPTPYKVRLGGFGQITCGGSSTSAVAPFALDPVVIPAGADSDNYRVCTLDPCSGASFVNRKVKVSGSTPLVLRGNNYVFCGILLDGSGNLRFEPLVAGSPVRVYIDTPANCGGAATGMTLSGSGAFESASTDPTKLQIYVVGSDPVQFSGSGGAVAAAIYAPLANIVLSGSGGVKGAIAGKKVTLSGSGGLTYDSAVSQILGSGSLAREQGSFRECAATTPSATPDNRC